MSEIESMTMSETATTTAQEAGLLLIDAEAVAKTNGDAHL